jgi:hypothetical protein
MIGLPRFLAAPPPDAAGRNTLLLLLAVPLALAAGTLAGFAIGRAGAPPDGYRERRLAEIATDLRELDGDYLLAAGDSHIARWRARRVCGLPVVNAGVNGDTAGDTARLLAELALPHPPRAVILTVGTNDANVKRFRDTADAIGRFGGAFRPLLRRLSRKTDLVLVTGVPPIDGARATGFSPAAASAIDTAAEAACRATVPCHVANPFRAGVALTDGIHLRDYEEAYRLIEPVLCAALAMRSRLRTAGANTR